MNTVIVVYSILLSLLVGGYIVLLFEVIKLKRFNDVFVKFMKSQLDFNNSQVEHNKNVFNYLTKTQKDNCEKNRKGDWKGGKRCG